MIANIQKKIQVHSHLPIFYKYRYPARKKLQKINFVGKNDCTDLNLRKWKYFQDKGFTKFSRGHKRYMENFN